MWSSVIFYQTYRVKWMERYVLLFYDKQAGELNISKFLYKHVKMWG